MLVILVGGNSLGMILIFTQIIQQQNVLTHLVAGQGDQYLRQTSQLLDTLAHVLPHLSSGDQQSVLTQTRLHYPSLTALYLLDADGRVLVEDTIAIRLIGLDLSNEEFFRQISQSKKIYFSLPFISPAIKHVAVTAAVPVMLTQNAPGVLAAELNLAQLQQAIERVDLGEQGISFIVDRYGRLVAYPDSTWVQEQRSFGQLGLVRQGMAGQQTFEFFYDNDRNTWLIGTATPMEQGWVVVTTQPVFIAMRPLLILMLISALVLGAGLALFFGRQVRRIGQITSPIASLAQQAEAVSTGQYRELPACVLGQYDEIISLGQSFNRMVQAVAERTAALVKAKESVAASLLEKEALLREIHHRVKNNLQVICALLDLQADTIPQPEAREAFYESHNRIRSMAQIHEQLTHTQNLARVDMAAYINDLVSSLRVAYGREDIAINVNVSEVTLPFDAVSPCGLLINELVSNAIKHAFPPTWSRDGSKQIAINLHPLSKTTSALRLLVHDNGIGLPLHVNPESPTGMGLTLVNLLSRQLNATLTVTYDEGTAFALVFVP